MHVAKGALSPDHYDEEFDVVVVGFGFAGAVAAIAAHDRGARVLLVEKMPDPGGISICAGGGLRLARNRDAAISYLRATNDGATPDDVLSIFADGMVEIESYVEKLASDCGARVKRIERAGNYPYPGHQDLFFLEIEAPSDFDVATAYPAVRALRGGPKLFHVVHRNVLDRNIDLRLSTTAHRLITSSVGRVQGIWLESDGRRYAVKALRGVILACGGFENSPDMQRQFWQLGPVAPAAFLGNTGDGIRMAADVGADLWHMWHFHGSYGFRHSDPAYPFGIRVKRLPDWVPPDAEDSVPMSWILVDRRGRRFTNEYQPYMHDTGHRDLDRVSPETMDRPLLPCFLLVDDDGRKMYPLGNTVYNDRSTPRYEWSQDNQAEVENGILQRADNLEELGAIIGCEAGSLEQTLSDWNSSCAGGEDKRFGRPARTMVAVRRFPMLVGRIWPVVSNTQGGPRHDGRQRVLDCFGAPIPGLHVAGELGSIWGFLYLSGGNLTECFVGGRIAGEEAAQAMPESHETTPLLARQSLTK
jgi:succinate dehydrogenase/fumarate reductase flavoprotein subunit